METIYQTEKKRLGMLRTKPGTIAKAICDQLEKIAEKFIFLLDDNHLTNRTPLEQPCDEIERRGIKKYFAKEAKRFHRRPSRICFRKLQHG